MKLKLIFRSVLCLILLVPAIAWCDEPDWHIGGYAGKYYDTEPAGVPKGQADYLNHFIIALTAYTTLWRAESWPLALELDGMVGHQFGLATLDEIAVAPVARWSGFPWNDYLHTSVRFGPLGVSYTTDISPLERGPNGEGSHTLNFLLIELAFALPERKTDEAFLRLHHRCTIYDLLNNFGANGEDFLTLGYRWKY